MLTIVRPRMTIIVTCMLCLASFALLAAPPSGGGGSKITVTAASPSEAAQGQELDVIVTGSGFESGSQVSYLVTGTTDGSQVDVISVEFISSTQLKTRIRPKDAALATAYDIEVRTLSGRKGKGTTLFRVKQSGDACIDTEFPTIAYAVRAPVIKSKGRFNEPAPLNLMLTGDGGCGEYALVSGYPWPGGSFRDLKFAERDGLGVVSWIESTETDASGVSTQRIKGAFFDILAGGVISSTQPVPVVLHEVVRGTGENIYLGSHDVRLDANGLAQIAVIDFTSSSLRNLRTIDPITGDEELILTGITHFFDQAGDAYRAADNLRWSPDGSALYFLASRSDDQRLNMGIARTEKASGAWQTAQLVVVNHHDSEPLMNAGLATDGRLAYSYFTFDTAHTTMNTGIIDPDLCVPVVCDTFEGAPQEGVVRDSGPVVWTASGSLLFRPAGSPVLEWSEPDLGIESGLSIDAISGSLDSSL